MLVDAVVVLLCGSKVSLEEAVPSKVATCTAPVAAAVEAPATATARAVSGHVAPSPTAVALPVKLRVGVVVAVRRVPIAHALSGLGTVNDGQSSDHSKYI
jgi:hypothetical protein